MANDHKLGTAQLLFMQALKMGLQPSWVTPNGMFAVQVQGQERYVNYARSSLNSDNGVSLAKDKYLTRLVLERHNMPNIPFARPRTQADALIFLDAYRKIIAKPVRGSGARDIHIITSPAQLQTLPITDYILEQYIVGQELRYLVLNSTILGVHRSEYGTSVDEHRPLQRISYPRPMWDPTLVASSNRIARILGLSFAAIDYMINAAGRAYILEVNTTPGLKWFHAPTSGPIVDVARHLLETVFTPQNQVSSKGLISTSTPMRPY
jgi:hypothetical protein